MDINLVLSSPMLKLQRTLISHRAVGCCEVLVVVTEL